MQVLSNTFILTEERQGKANIHLVEGINQTNVL